MANYIKNAIQDNRRRSHRAEEIGERRFNSYDDKVIVCTIGDDSDQESFDIFDVVKVNIADKDNINVDIFTGDELDNDEKFVPGVVLTGGEKGGYIQVISGGITFARVSDSDSGSIVCGTFLKVGSDGKSIVSKDSDDAIGPIIMQALEPSEDQDVVKVRFVDMVAAKIEDEGEITDIQYLCKITGGKTGDRYPCDFYQNGRGAGSTGSGYVYELDINPHEELPTGSWLWAGKILVQVTAGSSDSSESSEEE